MPTRAARNLRLTLGWPILLAMTGCNPTPPSSPATHSQAEWFEEVSQRVGLHFVHDSSAAGRYFMPESIGSGGALFDYDNDGRLDIYLIHHVPTNAPSKNQLFHQENDGHFRDVSAGSGLDVAGYGMGTAIGDINNDGLPDLFLTEYGNVRLFSNLGQGRFQDITHEAGITNTHWATAAAFFDYDRDGWLDLVVVNYVDYSPTTKCYDTRGALEYCGPQALAGTVTRLFHNRGSREHQAAGFEDLTIQTGLATTPGPGLGVFCADFNQDQWPDIFVADDGRPNRLYVNRRDGTFAEEAVVRGLAYTASGGTAANMGTACGDIDGNGLFDLFITHLNWEQHTLWMQAPAGLFQDRSADAGLGKLGWRGTGFGCVLADFNQDGFLDLAWVNGLIKRSETPLAPLLPGTLPFWAPYAQPRQLLAHDGNHAFEDVSPANPSFCAIAAVGRGLACGDIDNDGAVDLLVMNTGGPAQLFRNRAGWPGHWLLLRALDPAHGGRDAYGAEISVEAEGRRWWRLIQPSSSFLVSNDPRAHIGLGAHSRVDRLRVLWPDGTEELFRVPGVDRLVELRKGQGSVR